MCLLRVLLAVTAGAAMSKCIERSEEKEKHAKMTCLPVYTVVLGLLFLISDDSKVGITMPSGVFGLLITKAQET